MSQAISKHMKTIEEQRQTLEDWAAYEALLDRYWDAPGHIVVYDYDSIVAGYHHNLDIAEQRLKKAASEGNTVDISDAQVGHNLRLVIDPKKVGKGNIGSKQNARDDILTMDFYRCFDRIPQAQAHVLTIPHITVPKPDAPIANLALAFLVARYEPVVLASFEDPVDAMLYRLSI
ncbi:hypothetical protein J2855_003664 [Agrobacterium tumefaciens]|uniref:hypothetical protein n=1 Tax=Agrobacterium tumefaciens TaxID=358 RepID=UPI000DCF79AA|nr:hypothetical protein [Agrobacterium tumefaciens]MBP2510016.1 hypothetical protein [Agrobacterium tumefaciens]MBP2519464.1 hypothetical protein [Agrobacterium tumefaciens]MBP2578209.1 hypothetical protein [Agrobacterium tumefaciens]MBP2596155.1 hypothetical protein [Agrobacterium tumefaciens]